MGYHGSPLDSMTNAVERAKAKADGRIGSRARGVRRRKFWSANAKAKYEEGIAINKKYGLVPQRRQFPRYSVCARKQKVTLPIVVMPFAEGD